MLDKSTRVFNYLKLENIFSINRRNFICKLPIPLLMGRVKLQIILMLSKPQTRAGSNFYSHLCQIFFNLSWIDYSTHGNDLSINH